MNGPARPATTTKGRVFNIRLFEQWEECTEKMM